MNRLKNHIVYLMGSIDRSSDYGKKWRENITSFLHNIDIGVFNPCDKPVFNTSVNENEGFVEKINLLKANGKLTEAQRQMQEIVRIDLNFVDLSNFAILNVTPDIHMCGSYAEQTIACLQRKPVIVHCSQGIKEIPNWLFGVCDPCMFFDSWKDVENYIEHVAFSKIEPNDLDKKWRFIDYNKVFGKELLNDM